MIGKAQDPTLINLHASCVSLRGQGVLVAGASGTGKSALALHLIAFGATLVSDDSTEITRHDDSLIARCPNAIKGLIEARGVGLLNARSLPQVELALMIDMDLIESDRLPLPHWKNIHGVELPCLYKVEAPHFPAAILQFLKAGRKEPS